MKAIKTKYHGATNTRGSRFSAEAEGVARIYMPYDYELNAEENHRIVAEKLCDKYDWKGEIIGGGLKDCVVWVFKNSSY